MEDIIEKACVMIFFLGTGLLSCAFKLVIFGSAGEDDADTSAVDALVSVLRVRVDSAVVSQLACEALCLVCGKCMRWLLSLVVMFFANRSAPRDISAIYAVVAVMKAHVDNAGVSEEACKALGKISGDCVGVLSIALIWQ